MKLLMSIEGLRLDGRGVAVRSLIGRWMIRP